MIKQIPVLVKSKEKINPLVKSKNIINEAQFIDMIEKGLKKGCTIVSFDATTNARLLKKGNPFNGVMKKTRINGMVGFNYSNSVNRQRERESELSEATKKFISSPRPWGVAKNLAFVVHKGKFYLSVKCEKVLSPPSYYDNKGNLLTKEQVSPFLPKKRQPLLNQGVKKEIIYRTYSLTSFDSITMNKKTYFIQH